LHLGTQENNWNIDFRKFRTYLQDKYHITEAYYFLGYVSDEQQDLYSNLQKAGYIVSFREHSSNLIGKKKGNVDTDIVFEVMRILIERDDFDKILLVSGDGDYKKMVDYLIKQNRFKKILFPNNKFASSLYKQISWRYFDHLDNKNLQHKIGYIKRKGSLRH